MGSHRVWPDIAASLQAQSVDIHRLLVASSGRWFMVIFFIIVISVLLLALFFGVTVAGGRAHDRQNARRDKDG